jgi:hypothetical protein
MAERHARPIYLVVNRHEIRGDVTRPVTASEEAGAFRFSEMVTGAHRPRATPCSGPSRSA